MKRFAVITVLMALGLFGCENKDQPPQPMSAPSPTAAAQPVASPVASPSESMKISCEKGKDARILEVVKEGPGCIMNYTKNGKTTAETKSAHGDKHCLDHQKKVREKLERSGFKCQ